MKLSKALVKEATACGVSVQDRGIAMQLVSGKPCFLTDPKAIDISIEDIAHSLSNQCRFNGHTREFYSVAQHCVLVSENVPPELALEGLLHDAGEAYVSDLAKPLKVLVKGKFAAIEKAVDIEVCKAFDLDYADCHTGAVKEADKRVLATEKRELMDGRDDTIWGELLKPYDFAIDPLPPKKAKQAFLQRYDELTKTKGEHYEYLVDLDRSFRSVYSWFKDF